METEHIKDTDEGTAEKWYQMFYDCQFHRVSSRTTGWAVRMFLREHPDCPLTRKELLADYVKR